MKKVLQNSKKVTTKITADKKTAHFAYVASTTSSTGLQTFTPRLQKAKAAASNSHRHPLSNQPSLSTTPATAPAALAALSATQANSSASSGSAGSGSAA
ncbi:hypothetical protein, partial [Ventosimonas gracilis]|uniref:hypothetical protein n=1 Tax=Ventosimonas gracilis TaxID=1680762 RepID=UPI00195A21B8